MTTDRPVPENPEEWAEYTRQRVTSDTPWRGMVTAKQLLAVARNRTNDMTGAEITALAVAHATVAHIQAQMERTYV